MWFFGDMVVVLIISNLVFESDRLFKCVWCYVVVWLLLVEYWYIGEMMMWFLSVRLCREKGWKRVFMIGRFGSQWLMEEIVSVFEFV